MDCPLKQLLDIMLSCCPYDLVTSIDIIQREAKKLICHVMQDNSHKLIISLRPDGPYVRP